MIEATTDVHLAQAMHRAHQERARAFSYLWRAIWSRSHRRARTPFSRWA